MITGKLVSAVVRTDWHTRWQQDRTHDETELPSATTAATLLRVYRRRRRGGGGGVCGRHRYAGQSRRTAASHCCGAMTINHYFFSFFRLPLLFLFAPLRRRRRPFLAILRLLLFLPSHARWRDIPFLFFWPYAIVRLLIIIYCCRALWFYGAGKPKHVINAHGTRWCTISGKVPYRCRYSGGMWGMR